MINTGSQIISDEQARFPSLASLKAANNDLLKQRRETGNTREFLDKVESFLVRGQAAGATLNADDDRWAAQTILDYWANFLFRAGTEPPDVALADFDPALAPDLDDAQCPYLGLGAFPESKKDLFFGREKLVQKALDFLKGAAGGRFLAVIGPSGSGKSSLVLAGVLPALKAGEIPGSQTWRYYRPIVPGSDPLSSLAEMTGASRSTEAERAQQVRSFQDDSGRLQKLIEESHAEPAVIIVDQFEEVFTLCINDDARRAFINNLIRLVQSPRASHTVIVTIRSDFEVYVAKLPELQALFNRATVRVTPLSASELREAIEKPAEMVGLRFESGIVDQLIGEVLGEPAGLPLLQFTLLKLWKGREHNLITWNTFHELGSCREALTRSADKLYNGLIPELQRTLVRILLRLVRPGEGLEVFNNRVRRETLDQIGEPPERVERVLNMLIEEGLVRRSGSGAAGDVQIEVAHESLIRNWTRLLAWLEDERVNIRRRLRLTDAAREWEASGRDDDALLRGAQLDEALRYDDLSALETLFIQRSQTRQKRGRLILISFLVAVSIVFAALAIYSLNAESEARAAERKASSRQLAAQALSPLNKRLDLALLLSLEAINIDPKEPTVEARSSLLSNLQQSPYLVTFLHGLKTEPLVLAFDAEGKTLTSVNKDGTINTWDVATHQGVRSADLGLDVQVGKAAFSPDFKKLALGTNGGTIILWDVAEGRKDREFELGDSFVTSLAFSRDSKTLAASCNGPTTIAIWDVETGQKIRELRGHGGATTSVAFSPDGTRLASGSIKGGVILWDLARDQEPRSIEADNKEISIDGLAFSPDGMILASGDSLGISMWNLTDYKSVFKPEGKVTSLAFVPGREGTTLAWGSSDGAVILWDLRYLAGSGTICQIDRLTGHSSSVSTLAFSRDGKSLASGGSDKSAILWDVNINTGAVSLDYICDRRGRGVLDVFAPQRLSTPLSAKDPLLSVAFSPDGRFLAAETGKNSILLWSSANLEGEGEEIQGEAGAPRVGSLAFSPDGKTIAATNGSENIFLFDVAAKQMTGQLTGHSPQVNRVAFSPDGKILASGGADKTVILWDVAGRNMLRKLEGHSGAVTSLAFGRDGRLLASGSTDNTVALWDVSDTSSNGPTHVFRIRRPEASSGKGVESIALSPDGKILACGNWDNTINLWDMANREPLGQPLRKSSDQFIYQSYNITCLAFSPDSKVLASGSTDASIILWDIASQQQIGRFLNPSGAEPVSLAFESKGARLASTYKDKNNPRSKNTIYLWDVSLESWKKRACIIANRKFGPLEWERILGDRDYRPACDSFPSLESTP